MRNDEKRTAHIGETSVMDEETKRANQGIWGWAFISLILSGIALFALGFRSAEAPIQEIHIETMPEKLTCQTFRQSHSRIELENQLRAEGYEEVLYQDYFAYRRGVSQGKLEEKIVKEGYCFDKPGTSRVALVEKHYTRKRK